MASLQHKLMWFPSALDMLSDMSQTTGIKAVLKQANALEYLSHALRPVPFNDEVDDTLGDTLANVCFVITRSCIHAQPVALPVFQMVFSWVGVNNAEL